MSDDLKREQSLHDRLWRRVDALRAGFKHTAAHKTGEINEALQNLIDIYKLCERH